MKTGVRLGLGAAVTGVLLVAGPVTWMAVAGGTPAEPVSGEVLSDAVLPGGLPGLVKGPAGGDVDVSVVTLTIRPGAEGGWHSHAGTSLVSIVSGTASLVQAEGSRCVTRQVAAGQAFLEHPGVVHTVRNNGGADLVLTAVSLSPHGRDSGQDETAPTTCG